MPTTPVVTPKQQVRPLTEFDNAQILNMIRNEASPEYQRRMPSATQMNMDRQMATLMSSTQLTTPDTEPDAPADDTTPNPEPEAQDDGEPEDAGDDKTAGMANRLSALEVTVAELSKTIEAMRDAAAEHVLEDGPDADTTPDATEPTDDDYNGTYSTFDDLYED